MKKLSKLGVAVALAGLFVVGCGDSGLVKLENKNPTIDQKKYDLYVKKLQESEIKGGSWSSKNPNFKKTIKTSEYDFYHIDSMLKYTPIKEIIKKKEKECKKEMKEVPEFSAFCPSVENLIEAQNKEKEEWKREGKLYVFAVNKKNPQEYYEILLGCYECKNVDDVSIHIYDTQNKY
ncbi:hypothetical protein [uncultured Helicobacter sp.]|uniref:hypothetical protein n=1 Tax=uncultured Helicobacter sp. TaxID=175537 RepID=UPI00261978D9|nr:hypothetical protein [uncultured Helicobacter sp.]